MGLHQNHPKCDQDQVEATPPGPAPTGCHQAELKDSRKREKRRNSATFKVSIRLAQNILTDNVQDIS